MSEVDFFFFFCVNIYALGSVLSDNTELKINSVGKFRTVPVDFLVRNSPDV